MIEPKDLVNPSLKSGYDFVAYHKRTGKYAGQIPPTRSHTGGQFQIMPMCDTALEAAQAVCDYLNGDTAAPAAPALKSAGHIYEVDEKDNDPEYLAALGLLRDRKAAKEGKQGYVYCIREAIAGGGFSHVKIGYSTNPWKRVAELQTGNPRTLAIVCLKKGTEAEEKALHAKYIHLNILQEWFTVTKEMLLEFDLDAKGNPYETSTT